MCPLPFPIPIPAYAWYRHTLKLGGWVRHFFVGFMTRTKTRTHLVFLDTTQAKLHGPHLRHANGRRKLRWTSFLRRPDLPSADFRLTRHRRNSSVGPHKRYRLPYHQSVLYFRHWLQAETLRNWLQKRWTSEKFGMCARDWQMSSCNDLLYELPKQDDLFYPYDHAKGIMLDAHAGKIYVIA